MPKPVRTNRTENTRESPAPFPVLKKIREKDKPVRIRADASINSRHVDGRYLGKAWKEIDHVRKGPGSASGWGHLVDGGWVALDFVEVQE